ncbi:hypothetical protein CPC08DRAFT_705814 [Agrocybe pediades]|nr:hypothetical protein CPC08DRAFT_705814 [Agrocybe pediades]
MKERENEAKQGRKTTPHTISTKNDNWATPRAPTIREDVLLCFSPQRGQIRVVRIHALLVFEKWVIDLASPLHQKTTKIHKHRTSKHTNICVSCHCASIYERMANIQVKKHASPLSSSIRTWTRAIDAYVLCCCVPCADAYMRFDGNDKINEWMRCTSRGRLVSQNGIRTFTTMVETHIGSGSAQEKK